MDHYRLAIGMGSPHLKSMKDMPNRRRNIQSAKSTGGEVRVIIENTHTHVPTPSISKRAQSALPGMWAWQSHGSGALLYTTLAAFVRNPFDPLNAVLLWQESLFLS